MMFTVDNTGLQENKYDHLCNTIVIKTYNKDIFAIRN